MSECKACGKELSSGVMFCPRCGRRVTGAIPIPGPEQATGEFSYQPVPETAHLEFLGGPEDGRIIQLTGEKVTVGRREDNDVHIFSDSALSRRHAFIFRKSDQFWIEDRKSSFGTWVDGERVPVQTAAPMRDGSHIRLARTLLVFHLGEPDEVDLEVKVAQIEL